MNLFHEVIKNSRKREPYQLANIMLIPCTVVSLEKAAQLFVGGVIELNVSSRSCLPGSPGKDINLDGSA